MAGIAGLPWVNLGDLVSSAFYSPGLTAPYLRGHDAFSIASLSFGLVVFGVPSLYSIFLLLNKGVNELFENPELIKGKNGPLKKRNADLRNFLLILLILSTLFFIFIILWGFYI